MVKLGEFIAREFSVSIEKVMLLRHSSGRIKELEELGASVKQYTQVQPSNTRYDYLRDGYEPIEIVVVLVDNKVEAVFRVKGIEKEGTNYSLNARALVEADRSGQRKERPSRRFVIDEVSSSAVGKKVGGWEQRQRTTVQRSKNKFFDEIVVDLNPPLPLAEEVDSELARCVHRALQDSSEARRKRLSQASHLPIRIEVRSVAFVRNGDVIAEVLVRANGRCELCGQPAPFIRKSNGSPYLEVHHRKRLADNGEDTVENAHALCPNCHRREHFG